MSMNQRTVIDRGSNDPSREEVRGIDDATDAALNLRKISQVAVVMVVLVGSAALGFAGLSSSSSSSSRSSTSAHYSGGAPAGEQLTERSESSIDASPHKSDEQKPNFVFFMADDLPWNSIGYNNFDFEKVTPNLNRFASEGVVVESYYAQEICTPSRTSLFTGRYPSTIGQQFGEIMSDQIYGLNVEETLFPEVLKEYGGYKTYMVGKWNMGNSDARYLPTHRGFDEFFGYLGGGINPYTKSPVGYGYVDFMYADSQCYNVYDGDDFDEYSTYIFRNKALDAVASHDFDAAPMLLYVAFHGVHNPLSYDGMKINGEDIGEGMYEMIQETISEEKRQMIASVMALMDQSMKQIYDAIKARGQGHNTYFIFASDNGGCNSSGGFNGPLRGDKGSLFEGRCCLFCVMW